MRRSVACLALVVVLGTGSLVRAEDYFREPYLLRDGPSEQRGLAPGDTVEEGTAKGVYHDDFGYLPWLLC